MPHIEVSDNNGRPYLKLVNTVNEKLDNGKRKSGKDVVLNIGFLEKYDDGKPDYLKRLRESFKRGVPLIPELEKYSKKEQPVVTHTIKFIEGTDDCVQDTYLYAHKFLERFFEELDISQVTRSYKNYDGITFDVYGFIRLLLCGRILNPASKIATTRQNDDYFDKIIRDEFDRFDVYDTLSFLSEHKSVYLKRINNIVEKQYPRGNSMICYDVTNFYYETDKIMDENDIRQIGVSKEYRQQPIVQVGLFADGNGIPIGYGIFKGNKHDNQTFKAALRDNIDQLPSERFVLVGDRGMFTYDNVDSIMDSGNGYIVSKSILKSTTEVKNWIFDEEKEKYTYIGENFRYKSKTENYDRTNEKTGELEHRSVKSVVYWSKHMYDRCVAESDSYLKMIDKIMHSDRSLKVTSKVNKLLTVILGKTDCVDIKTGQVLKTKDLRPLIDEEKVEAYKKTFGYFQIITSETYLDDTDVIYKYHGLKQIEDVFRVMKGSIKLRPAYVWTEDHIDGHVFTCVVALIIIRLIQIKVRSHEEKMNPDANIEEKLQWTYAITADRVIKALKKWTIGTLPQEKFIFQNLRDTDLKRIFDAYGIEIPKKLYTRATLKSVKTGMDIFDKKER